MMAESMESPDLIDMHMHVGRLCVANVEYFRSVGTEGRISPAAYRKIARENAIRVFRLD